MFELDKTNKIATRLSCIVFKKIPSTCDSPFKYELITTIKCQ